MPLVLPLPKVTAGMPWRSSSAVLPWLNSTAAEAPAAAAFSIFCSKVHTPRWRRAMLPAGKPAKSSGSQPDVAVLPSPSWMSTGVTGAVTSPGSVWSSRPKSVSST